MANVVLKKTLLIFGTGALIVGAAGSLVFRPNYYDDNVILVQMNHEWGDFGYQAAANATNDTFKQLGLDYRIKVRDRGIFDEYDQINKKGVRDRNISDVFMLGFDRYLGYVEQNNILEISKEIKDVLLKTPEDEEHYGAKVDDEGNINIEGENRVAWKTAKLNRDGDYFGIVPASVENNIWVFDKKILGIENNQLVGREFEETKRKHPEYKDLEKPSLENLEKINLSQRADHKTPSFFRSDDGFLGGNVFNAAVAKNQEKILEMTDETDASLLWLKKGKSPFTKDVNDFDSLFENDDFKQDVIKTTDILQSYFFSFGSAIRNSLLGTGSGGVGIDQEIDNELADGTMGMQMISPHKLSATITHMFEKIHNRDVGIKSVDAVTIDNSENSPNLSGFAGGYGWAIKSSITNKTLTDNQGNNVSKSQAAMMFIKEISQPKYAAGWAKIDGKYSTYKKNVDVAAEELNQGTEIDKYVSQGMTEVSDGYVKVPTVVSARPTTALFEIYWEAFAKGYRITIEQDNPKKGEFYNQFMYGWNLRKATYKWG